MQVMEPRSNMTDEKIEIKLDEDEVIPSLWEVNCSFDVIKTENHKGIKGEHEARMVVFTNFILGERPVILKGSRASGKTAVTEVVSQYARNIMRLSLSSEKGHLRNNDINTATHIIVPEINQANDQLIEMLKAWGEGATSRYSRTMPNKIDTEIIELKAKPFITSIADENKNVNLLGDELLSRLTIVRLDSSVKQNIAVIEEKLQRAANPFYKKGISQEKVKKYIKYVHALPSIRNFEFVYPAGVAMRSAIPPLFTDSRRDTDKYLHNTYGITIFHYHNRMRKVIGEKTYLFVTPEDMWYNHRIFQNVLLDSSLKCGRIEKEILDILKEYGDEEKVDEWNNKVKGLKINEIHTQLLRRSYTPTIDAVNKYCTQLMETGYIVRNEEVRPHRFYLNQELKREYTPSINWRDIVEACKENISKTFPDIADEYISKHCENIICIDPFTGKEVNILEWDDNLLTEKPKKREEPKPITVAPPEKIQISMLDLYGEEDPQDKIQKLILDKLSDKKEHEFSDFKDFGKESDIDSVLKHLKNSQEIIEKNGKYLRLM